MSTKTWRPSNIGPKVGPSPEPATAEDADPGKGAKVSRCTVCGMPSGKVMVGVWCGLYGSIRICEHCWFAANPPDPLNVAA